MKSTARSMRIVTTYRRNVVRAYPRTAVAGADATWRKRP